MVAASSENNQQGFNEWRERAIFHSCMELKKKNMIKRPRGKYQNFYLHTAFFLQSCTNSINLLICLDEVYILIADVICTVKENECYTLADFISKMTVFMRLEL